MNKHSLASNVKDTLHTYARNGNGNGTEMCLLYVLYGFRHSSDVAIDS